MKIKNCILIDDSERVCGVFRSLGGVAFQPNGEEEIIKILIKLNNQL